MKRTLRILKTRTSKLSIIYDGTILKEYKIKYMYVLVIVNHDVLHDKDYFVFSVFVGHNSLISWS